MSLITRCPTCETMFRVVPDQLRVSEGWVRCGHCSEVFDATQNMVPPAGAPAAAPAAPVVPPPSPQPAARPAPSLAASPPPAAAPAGTHPSASMPAAATRAEPAAPAGTRAMLQREAADAGAIPEPRHDAHADDTSSAAEDLEPEPEPDPDWLDAPSTDPQTVILAADDDEQDAIDTLPPPELDFPPPPATPSRPDRLAESAYGASPIGTEPPPSFLRDDQRPSVWRRPAVRIALVVALVLLLALLATQFLVKERDRVAAMQPGMLPVLEALCAAAACSIAPLHQIESIVIDSSSFSRVRDDDYRLGFALKNTAPIDVAMPAIELSLTDPQDQAVIRRVILPAEFGARSAALAGASVWTGSLALSVQPQPDGQRIAGYRLLAFYP